jgi:hypothetical protein
LLPIAARRVRLLTQVEPLNGPPPTLALNGLRMTTLRARP